MGDLLHFPTPAGPTANHIAVVWRGCWACGLVLFDDEPQLCGDCDVYLNSSPAAPLAAGGRPAGWYLHHIRPDTIATMAQAITETGAAQAETQAAAWAGDHDLDDRASATYVGDVRGRALTEYSNRCQHDAQVLGEQLGWGRGA